MRRLELSAGTGRCDFFVGEPLDRLKMHCNADRIVVVTDRNVRSRYGSKIRGLEVVEIIEGEGAKTLATVSTLYERFLKMGLDRSSFIVGVGGGAVCDVTGFTASTYMRGLRFGFAPTTLLAQVDASAGGKNGVNLMGYKNMVGTIRQPEFCLIDFGVLRTLQKKEIRSGLAEIVKCGAIADAKLFGYLEKNFRRIMELEHDALKIAVSGALKTKITAVEADEMDRGERMALNFGHTVGHALEKTAGIPHGEAISIGMVEEARLSVHMGMLKQTDFERIKSLLSAIGLPTRLEADMDAAISAMRSDKKRRGGDIDIVLLEGIGNARVARVGLSKLNELLAAHE